MPATVVQHSDNNDSADFAIPTALADMLARKLTYEKSANLQEVQNDMDHLRFFDKTP